MRIAVIADSHLGGPMHESPEASLALFLGQLEGLPAQGVERLIFLGDIFQVWVGKERFETPRVAAFLDAVQRLRQRGVRVEYIEGNRDFFIGGAYSDAFDKVALSTTFEVGGRRYLATHGDQINEKWLKSWFWRRLSKNPLSEWLCTLIPEKRAKELILGTEQKLRRRNDAKGRKVPFERVEAFARKILRGGYDHVLLGHFHEPHVLPVAGGEVEILDAWFRSHAVEIFPR